MGHERTSHSEQAWSSLQGTWADQQDLALERAGSHLREPSRAVHP